jgi:2-polyprenyl-3-methyl-5-hydroxy-6-metoxy-1,4-benzoquinol methylase
LATVDRSPATLPLSDCAHRFGGPILEVAAGTGRILIPLAKSGYEVAGLDQSGAMLQVAREKAQRDPQTASRIQLVEGDMRGFTAAAVLLALIPARAFQHVIEPEDQRRMLRCVSTAT